MAKAVCVFVHGRGQSPEDMQSSVLSRLDAPEVAFVLPRAPTGSWYAARAVDPLSGETRAALRLALDHLADDIASARAAYPDMPLMLGGFSQGACLSLEYVFAGLPAPHGVIALTGCRVGQRLDDRQRMMPPYLPVWLTGSDNDPWIPVTAFAEAALELGQAKTRLRAELFPGRAHEVSDAEVAMLGRALQMLMNTFDATRSCA